MSTIPAGPCVTCPYAKATPPGVWHPDEYARLPEYDKPTFEQPAEPFGCHYDNGDLCGGWLATHLDQPHDRDLLALRLGVGRGSIPPEVFDFHTDVECYGSGLEAMLAGTADFTPEAETAIERIERIRERRDRNDDANRS